MIPLKEAAAVLRSAGPVLWRALRSGQIVQPQCVLTQPDPDILCEFDTPVVLPDGTTLLASVFRSKKAAREGRPLPVIMSAQPYDANILPARGRTPFGGPPQQYRLFPQASPPRFSTLTSWEAPDPDFWVKAGYAVVNLNLPGYGGSEGPPSIFSNHQSKCFYEAIEWVARQPWSSGAVGLSGVSYLAISQFHVAACRHYGGPPPSLKCISPWEGMTDPYRDFHEQGGVSEQDFPTFWWHSEVKVALTGSEEDFIRHNRRKPQDWHHDHPLYDAFWAEMAAPIDDIDLPMLVCGSFSDHNLHSEGSVRAFVRARSARKWLYTHRTSKWTAYYSDEVSALIKEFMDCFVKGETGNGFLERPPVFLEVRSSRDVIHERRTESQWPLEGVRYRKLFPANGTLRSTMAETPVELSYDGRGGSLAFTHIFERDTELTGEMKARLWVELRDGFSDDDRRVGDMTVFVALDKLDIDGRSVRFHGSAGMQEDWITRGLCRVSRRELDPERSKPWLPVLTGTSVDPLTPGEIVPIEIALMPSSTHFAAGEGFRLVVSAKEIVPTSPFRKDVRDHRGTHVLHVGGKYDTHLLIPDVPPLIGVVTDVVEDIFELGVNAWTSGPDSQQVGTAG
ncbi:CocE/NonD family hydrolase [Sphingomonas sp. KR1UV-12]|uniref:CocE/NonD family hydrolase n=1 Tax=Sphingomonas aurea TaxID=3063994 RepID=A0ABT9EIQ3_9SPHN|nr:CocE/NonD family hydrolase [Sphingomonas sp. KR1UV-12]MDP1026844.1 CocE/NonD family hydrolase [Sphingomonas sp. KR1UV-12]